MNTSPYAALREDTQAQLSRTGTSLPLDGPVEGFDAPVAIGASLWGPFHRLYLQAQADGHTHTICSGAFETSALPDGDLRIATTLHVPREGGAIRAGIALQRAATGALREADLTDPPGDDPDRAAMLAAARDALSGPGCGVLPRGTLEMGQLFALGPPESALLCRVLGRSRHQGRPVLVARCTGTRPVAEPGWTGLVVAEGHVAVDVETGIVLLSALVCRVIGPAAPGPQLRLQAWFTLRADAPAAG